MKLILKDGILTKENRFDEILRPFYESALKDDLKRAANWDILMKISELRESCGVEGGSRLVWRGRK